jgi:hypothetical protein
VFVRREGVSDVSSVSIEYEDDGAEKLTRTKRGVFSVSVDVDVVVIDRVTRRGHQIPH